MNKEQLRKEFVECYNAGAYYALNPELHPQYKKEDFITTRLSAFESVEIERQQEKLRTWRVLPLDDNMSAVLCKNCGVNQMPPPTYVNQDGSFNCVNCGEKLYPFGKREWEYRKTAKEILFLYGKTLKDCNKMFNKNQILIPEHIFIIAMEQTTTLPPANEGHLLDTPEKKAHGERMFEILKNIDKRLPEGEDYVEQLKELLRFDHCPEILIENPGLIKSQLTTPESIEWANECIARYEVAKKFIVEFDNEQSYNDFKQWQSGLDWKEGQWEYSVRPAFADWNLGELGKEGWQLCAVNDKYYYFKRPLPKPPKP